VLYLLISVAEETKPEQNWNILSVGPSIATLIDLHTTIAALDTTLKEIVL
jgi:hypothetical protein